MKRVLLPYLIGLVWLSAILPATAAERPNVLLIMTDDQGYGDLGATGNPVIKTPVLDQLAKQSVEIESFYVCPVCAPTRAGLMTGRYNYRTGVTDTWLGRAMMHADEVTIAEMFRDAGYHTAIFGKWHLGDSYPMRPGDQGFEESLVHTGGGLCQPSGPPDNSYFDPSLLHNGHRIKTKGYCSDVFTDAAIRFITENRDEPFLVYLPFNCPHGPFQIAEEYSKPYEDLGMKPSDFPAVESGHPLKSIPGNTAKVYGMVQNIDDNLRRLFKKLDDLGLRKNTIVIFLTDNGPNGARYKAGMKAHKGSVYEGGIRTVFYIRWPAELTAGTKVDRIAANIDVVPTLLAACSVARPDGVKLDGLNLLPLLAGEQVDWPDRTLFSQWHRGDAPVPYRAFAARSQDYKLLHAGSVAPGTPASEVPFELYDMRNDPLETKDIAAEKPEVVEKLRRQYDAWLADVARDHGYEAPRIQIGTPHENPTILTRQDWRGPAASWSPGGLGYWELAVPQAGTFEITCLFRPTKQPAMVHFRMQEIELEQKVEAGVGRCIFSPVKLAASPAERLEAWIVEEGTKKPVGMQYVNVKRLP